MIRSITIDVTAGAGAEQVEPFVRGVGGKARRVVEMWCEQAAAGRLVAYLDTDQIVDVGGECDQILTNPVKVDLALVEGQVFSAGWLDTAAGGITGEITVFYSEE